MIYDMKTNPKAGSSTYVILLTSGVASLGITDPASILSSVSIALDSSETMFSLHCLGVGEYQDPNLLQRLATLRNTGSYHFAPNEHCLSEALSDVVCNIQHDSRVRIWDFGSRRISLPSFVISNFNDMANCETAEMWQSIAQRLHAATELLSSPHQQKIVHVLVELSFKKLQKCVWAECCARCLGFASEEFIAELATWIHERGVKCDKVDKRGSGLKGWKGVAVVEEVESEVVFAERFKVSHDVLGKGAYGSIYTARDVMTGTQVRAITPSSCVPSHPTLITVCPSVRLL